MKIFKGVAIKPPGRSPLPVCVMHSDVTIREMFPEDVPVVAAVERLCFSMPWSETSFYSEIYSRFSTTRVAESGGVIIGYICMRQVADECHLMDLAVHPGHRERGVATSLFNSVLPELKTCECRFLYLEVRASNDAAIKFYRKFGFHDVGIRKNYYINPVDDGIIMRLEI